jgi:hypothetical protein
VIDRGTKRKSGFAAQHSPHTLVLMAAMLALQALRDLAIVGLEPHALLHTIVGRLHSW